MRQLDKITASELPIHTRLPVVDGLPRRPNEQPAILDGEVKSLALRSETLRAETNDLRRGVFDSDTIGLCTNSRECLDLLFQF